MTATTPEDRLRAVEKHIYNIQALAEAFEAISSFAHLTERQDLGFNIGFLVERMRREADAVLAAASGRELPVERPVPPSSTSKNPGGGQ